MTLDNFIQRDNISPFPGNASHPTRRHGDAGADRAENIEAAPAAYLARTPKRSLNDLLLPPKTREQLEHGITMVREHDTLFDTWELSKVMPNQAGSVMNFYGPPGTGKTLAAEAVAEALGLDIIEADLSALISDLQGGTGKNIKALFAAARSQSALLFLDEADGLLSARAAKAPSGSEADQNAAKAVLFKELDRYSGTAIFATNFAENFDPAVVRRIHLHVGFELPDASVRQCLWRHMLSTRVPGRDELDFDQLASQSEGMAGGDIANAVRNALVRAVRKVPCWLGQADVEDAIDSVQCARREVGRSAIQVRETVLTGESRTQTLHKLRSGRKAKDRGPTEES